MHLFRLTISTANRSYNNVTSFSPIPIHHSCFYFLIFKKKKVKTVNNKMKYKQKF